ncbi:MAG: tRNA uridine-5-carboxymethylaminomethyl(34) synthesis GTPase MnmE, partial [Armatimonadota bacterium]|nr:tRNA uridine-5-carboxymethylaminomethyl(34) synthesis GTPase MnmE [Armatimonadota bacterium]
MIEDTIAAIATPVGRAGIGVIRISGAAAIGVADTVFKTKPRKDDLRPSDFASHTVHLGAVIHPQTGEMIDEALLTVFRSPYSYTGEDVAEISCHGGTSTMRRVLDAVL